MRYGAQNHVHSQHTLSICYFDGIHPALSMIICIDCLRQQFLVFNNCQQCNAAYVVLTHDAICYRLYSPGIKYWWGRDFPSPHPDWPWGPPRTHVNVINMVAQKTKASPVNPLVSHSNTIQSVKWTSWFSVKYPAAAIGRKSKKYPRLTTKQNT
jgi:hypothetical protein